MKKENKMNRLSVLSPQRKRLKLYLMNLLTFYQNLKSRSKRFYLSQLSQLSLKIANLQFLKERTHYQRLSYSKTFRKIMNWNLFWLLQKKKNWIRMNSYSLRNLRKFLDTKRQHLKLRISKYNREIIWSLRIIIAAKEAKD